MSLPGISLQNATGSLTFTNSNLNGSVNFYVNASGANTRGVYIDGATGLLYVAADPTGTMGVATKNYVDNNSAGLNIHDPVLLASTQDLATYTGATVTYNNGTSGVGAKPAKMAVEPVVESGVKTAEDAAEVVAKNPAAKGVIQKMFDGLKNLPSKFIR